MTKRAENLRSPDGSSHLGRDTRIALFFRKFSSIHLVSYAGFNVSLCIPRPYFIGWNFTEGHESIHLFNRFF